MILFSTMFYVKKELTKEKLIEMAFNWINSSPHYGFDHIVWDGEEFYERECEKQKFSVILSNDQKMLAIRLEHIDEDNVLWTNDFVYEENTDQNVFYVRLARDAVDKDTIIPRGYHRPRLMRMILKQGYGADDGDLATSDQPVIISHENLELAENVICGKTTYLLPVVYVTRQFSDDAAFPDVRQLARDLAGSAHVLVEESAGIADKLKERTDGKNPFDGAVQVYYTDKVSTRILPEESDQERNFRFKIVNSVCNRLALVKVDERYSWSTIRYQKLLEKYRQDQQENIELEKACDEILELKEKEHAQLVEDMEAELNELRTRVMRYEYGFQSGKKSQDEPVVLQCSEAEFYEGEILDMILEILQEEKKKMDGDPNQKGWRKYHVLTALLKDNEIVGNGKQLALELKEILTRIDRISAKDKKRLAELGFVSREGKHNKLYFHDDDRYLITLAKTPSDFRSASNNASAAINTIICS